MSHNITQSHLAVLAGRVNDAFHSGRPEWKPNAPLIKKTLALILDVDENYLNKVERMRCSSMTDDLVTELVKNYGPDLARANHGGGKIGRAHV